MYTNVYVISSNFTVQVGGVPSIVIVNVASVVPDDLSLIVIVDVAPPVAPAGVVIVPFASTVAALVFELSYVNPPIFSPVYVIFAPAVPDGDIVDYFSFLFNIAFTFIAGKIIGATFADAVYVDIIALK